jgi:hypothetical protein
MTNRPRPRSNVLAGNLPVVTETPQSGPGARDDGGWRRKVHDEMTVQGLSSRDVFPVARLMPPADDDVIGQAIDDLELPPSRLPVEDGYEPLARILDEALAQAQSGKGKERHANALPFDEQPILAISRLLGGGVEGTGFQAIKKMQEAVGMLKRGNPQAAVRELLGSIVYTAAMVLLIEEQDPKTPKR